MIFYDDLKYYVQLDSFSKGIVGACNVLAFSSGFHFLCILRLVGYMQGVPLVGSTMCKIFSYLNVLLYGCHISPNAKFGKNIYFPHPAGIVIGADWDICDSVTIMQNTTLGKKIPSAIQNKRSRVSSGVTICAGAVLAGEISIGKNSIVGANSVVLNDIKSNHLAVGVPAIEKNRKS